MSPTLFIVPGIYEGPEGLRPLIDSLAGLGYTKVVTTRLPSTGTTSKSPNPVLITDDIAAIAADMQRAVEEAGPNGVIGLFHSAAGTLGSAAIKGLSAKERKASGQVGGVVHTIYLAAAPGVSFKPEFMVFDVSLTAGGMGDSLTHTHNLAQEEAGTQTCKDPLNLLFHDLPSQEAQAWLPKVRCQPFDYFRPVEHHRGWENVSTTHLVTVHDRLVPLEAQEASANLTGGEKIVLDCGHMPALSMPGELATIVAGVIDRCP